MTEKIPDTFIQLIGGLYSSQMRDVDDRRVQVGDYWVSKDQRRRPRGRRCIDAFDVICELPHSSTWLEVNPKTDGDKNG